MEIAICKCSLTPESIMSLSDAPWGTGTAIFRCAPIAYAQRAIRKRLDPDFEAYRQLIRELSRRGLWPKEGLPEKCPNFLRCADLKKGPIRYRIISVALLHHVGALSRSKWERSG